MMKLNMMRLAMAAAVCATSLGVSGQLFRPMGLGPSLCETRGEYYNPRMHVEGDILYACTANGLYSRDLSVDGSEWKLAGFEGIPLQDYARRGDDMLALRYNADSCFLLLSQDDGKTYRDITPDMFHGTDPKNKLRLASLAQHPDDPNTLLVMADPWGMFRSTDFGQSWNNLTDYFLSLHMGFHPARPEIIYNSGCNDGWVPLLNISYDGGQTWNSFCPFDEGDGNIYQLSFNPFNADQWIYGGMGIICSSDDNGHTWTKRSDGRHDGIWSRSAYDNENPNVVYMAGNDYSKNFLVMCSTDGGQTWPIPQAEPVAEVNHKKVYDLQQYGDKLLLFTEKDIFEVSKAELLDRSRSAVNDIAAPVTDKTSATYDMQGRKVNLAQPGIYIQGGKKVVIK